MPVPDANVFPYYWGNTPKWVVIHKTASGGTAQDIANFFYHVLDRRSSHYIVDQAGVVVQCVSEHDGAGANGDLQIGHAPYLPSGINMNLVTISIEHVDPAPDNSTPLTEAQKAASFALVLGICQRHNIPMRAGDGAGGIIRHADISPQTRALCPNNYPFDELYAYLQQGGHMSIDITNPVAASWYSDIGGWWHLKGANPDLAIHGEILNTYRTMPSSGAGAGITELGKPLTNEIALIDKDGKQLPGGAVYQVFERGGLVYDPQRALSDPPYSHGPCYRLLITPYWVAAQTPPTPPMIDLRKEAAYDAIKTIIASGP